MKRNALTLFGMFCYVIASFIIFSFTWVGSYDKYAVGSTELKKNPLHQGTGYYEVGIVFGSGITKDGKPYKELQGRLDAAAEALKNHDVTMLLLSGDNRFAHYNEPQAMITYLVREKHISPTLLQPDFAGRSTYETCERAHKIFGLHSAILFTAKSHLPRALFTCRKMGIEAYGTAAGADANNAFRRELLARSKAVFNIYVKGENTILGEKHDISCCRL